MKGYAKTIFTRHECRLLTQARRLVDSIPEPKNPGEIRCHELVRAVGMKLDLPHQDGKFGSTDHSWLTINSDRSDRMTILDVYAVGILPMVILVDTRHQTLRMPKLYRPSKELRDDVRHDVVANLVLQITEATNGSRPPTTKEK